MFETLVWIKSLYLFVQKFIIFQRAEQKGLVFVCASFFFLNDVRNPYSSVFKWLEESTEKQGASLVLGVDKFPENLN